MYRIIVVDDEAAITDWLYQAISEQFAGILEVYRAYSGEECLNLMTKGGVHIVMTDISMPVFSGLDLLSALSDYYPKTKKMILSAYDDFQYAREAIGLGVSAYVLKGDGDEVIFDELRRVIAELDEEQERFLDSEKSKVQPEQNPDVQRHRILRHYLRGLQGVSDLNRQVYPRWIDFDRPMDVAMITLEVQDAVQRRFLVMALEDSLAEYLKPYHNYEMVEVGISEVILLVQPQETAANTRIVPSLYAAYENAQNSFYHVTQQYTNMIYTRDQVLCADLPEKYEDFRTLLKNSGNNYECSILLREDSARINAASQMERGNVKREIAMVCSYIEQNMDKDLSLILLADVVYMNPSYLSHLFRLQTGTTISEYIRDARLARCKQMLADPQYHIHQVARAVGYDNASYFTRFFKKMTGMTPQAYRQQMK